MNFLFFGDVQERLASQNLRETSHSVTPKSSVQIYCSLAVCDGETISLSVS